MLIAAYDSYHGRALGAMLAMLLIVAFVITGAAPLSANSYEDMAAGIDMGRVEKDLRTMEQFGSRMSGYPGNLATAAVLTELYGKAPYFTRCGGSIPACSLFLKTLGVYTVNFSFSYQDENLHAPNEFVRLESLRKGRFGYIRLLHALASTL